MKIQFDCPHCGASLEGNSQQEGMTLPCPECEGLVRLEKMSTKEMVKTGLLAGALTVFAVIFGADNW